MVESKNWIKSKSIVAWLIVIASLGAIFYENFPTAEELTLLLEEWYTVYLLISAFIASLVQIYWRIVAKKRIK